MTELTWRVRSRAPADVLDGLGVGSPLLAQLLLNRGITSPEQAAQYLDGSEVDIADPFLLAGMPQAVERIAAALGAGERIAVYGDYDVDGLSGATLVARTLEALGAEVDVFIPHRERDGYGLNSPALEALAAKRVTLVVSVDCGVSAVAEVAAAASAGLDVVVTDHHQVPAELPAAIAVVNPHRPDCDYPFKHLAGAGVALKLAQALLLRLSPSPDRERLEAQLFELAMLGTVADVMPLIGENRSIVRRGLQRLRTQPSPGLRALCRYAKVDPRNLTAEDISFRLAPRLNAAGRMADAMLAHQLLAARTEPEAEACAEQLDALNLARRSLTDQAIARARAAVADDPGDNMAGLVVSGDYPVGLLGLVAARLAEQCGRPTAVVRVDEELCRGSVRGIPGFDTVAAVAACGDLLLAFGGHKAAAGLSLVPDNVDAFRARFRDVVAVGMAELPPPEPRAADCRLGAERLNPALCDLLDRLEPCGQGNPSPLFETRGMLVRDARVSQERHVQLRLAANGTVVRGILFDGAESGPRPGDVIDALYRVRRNFWQDSYSIDVELAAWRPAIR
jgi:single-stranded-DNA-specific exonuclease